MLEQTSWDDIGRTIATQTSLFTITRDALKGTGVGPEIVSWLCGAGRAELADAIHVLASKFIRERSVRLGEGANSVLVNVAWRADAVGQQKQDWVEVCRKGKTVYIGNRRVALKQLPEQHAVTKVDGYTAMQGLHGFEHVHPMFIRAFATCPALVPNDWRSTRDEAIRHITFCRTPESDCIGEYVNGFYVFSRMVLESHYHLKYAWDETHYYAVYE